MNTGNKKVFFLLITLLLCISGVSAANTGTGFSRTAVPLPVSLTVLANESFSGQVHHTTAQSSSAAYGSGTTGLFGSSGYKSSTFTWSVPAETSVNLPWGIITDNAGNIYVADDVNYTIWKFGPDGSVLRRIGSYGTGSGQFAEIACIAVNSSGYLYAVDKDNNRIEVFDPNGGYVTQWGTGGTAPGQFDAPIGLAVNASGYVRNKQ